MESSVIKRKRLTKEQRVKRLLNSDHFTVSSFQRNVDTAMCSGAITMSLYQKVTGALQTLDEGMRAGNLDEADLQLLRALYLMDRGRVHIDSARFNVQMTPKGLLTAIEQFDLDAGGVLGFVKPERATFKSLADVEQLVSRVFTYASYIYGRECNHVGDYEAILKRQIACSGKGEDGKWCITEGQRLLMEMRHFSKNEPDSKVFHYLTPRPQATDDGSGATLKKTMAW